MRSVLEAVVFKSGYTFSHGLSCDVQDSFLVDLCQTSVILVFQVSAEVSSPERRNFLDLLYREK